MAKNYDIMNGGLERLIVDVDNYKKYLAYASGQLVTELSNITKDDIIANAGLAEEDSQVLDIYSRTSVVQGVRNKNRATNKIINTSNKATFAEFGYGIVGKGSPYAYNDFINMAMANFTEYDMDSPSKRISKKDGRRFWFYKDLYGNIKTSYGATPKNIFYNASRKAIRLIPVVANVLFNRWK
jgi:hypothetical protein